MKLNLFLIAAMLMAAASVLYGGENMQKDTRIIQLNEHGTFNRIYTYFLLSCVNGQYLFQGEYTTGKSLTNSQQDNTKKVEKVISKEVFENLFAACLELDIKKVIAGSLKTGGRDGSDVNLLFGSGALTVSIAVWSPYGSTKERDLTQFMEIYTAIYKLAE